MKFLALALLAGGSLHAASLFSDSFETCSPGPGSAPVGWATGGATLANPLVYHSSNVFVPAHSGVCALDLGPSGNLGDNGGFASTTIAGLVSGTDYTFSFWHRTEATNGAPPSTPLRLDLTGATTFTADLNSPSNGYLFYAFSFNAANTSLTIRFTDIQNGPIAPYNGYNSLIDDVNLDDAAAPEPGSLFLITAGALAAGLSRCARR